MFTKDLAEKFKDKVGQRYRPSNGDEGIIFFNEFCDVCIKYDSCRIIGRTMVLDDDDPNYPTEWQYGEDGQPTCTAFDAEQ